MNEMNTDYDAMLNLLKNQNGGKKVYEGDKWKENLFKYKLKADGTWDGIIRFLPRPVGDGDGNPSMKVLSHAFQGDGGWLIENCPYTYGEPCPVCEHNAPIYRAGGRPDGTGRKTSYYSNILVIKDPQNPDNEGKVFIWKYGKGIYETVMDKCDPKSEMDVPINVFHPKNGTNFRLKIKLIKTVNAKTGKPEEYPDFKSSTFSESVIPLADDVIANASKQLHKLSDICSPDKVKSYEALTERFDKVMGKRSSVGASVTGSAPTKSAVTVDDLPQYAAPTVKRDVVDDNDNDDFIKSLQADMM